MAKRKVKRSFFQVRMVSPAGTLCPTHHGWVVEATNSVEAKRFVSLTGIDNSDGGEFSEYSQFTADVLYFDGVDYNVAELH